MLSDKAPPRIDYDELEFDDQLALLKGHPFSGIVFSRHTGGSLESEGLYKDGLPEGVQQKWYQGGRLERRWIAIRGKGSSESWSWHSNGQMHTYRRNVDGRPVELKAWDADGREVSFPALEN